MRTKSWRYLLTVLAAAGLLLIGQGYFGPSSEAGKAVAHLNVRIADSQGNPVPNALVVVKGQASPQPVTVKRRMGSKTLFKTKNLAPGEWTLVVTDPSGVYQTYEQKITLKPDATLTVVVVLQNAATPAGKIKDNKAKSGEENRQGEKEADGDQRLADAIARSNTGPAASMMGSPRPDAPPPKFGPASQEVMVTTNTPTVDTVSASVGGTVTQTEIQETPIVSSKTNGRRSQDYLSLVPGTRDSGKSGNYYVHGVESSKVGTSFGGVSTRDPASGTFQGENQFNTESYEAAKQNEFRRVNDHPLSTFSIDVDTASYANVRRFLNQGQLPPSAAVRVEELINYFDYQYNLPEASSPFSVQVETASCPWAPGHRLARIGIKGYELDTSEAPLSNLVFLLDVSGSMRSTNKLPLVKQGMKKLINNLGPEDRVAIVTYAGTSGLALASTPVTQRGTIEQVINSLGAGGSTNGAGGIMRAYQVARDNFIEGGNNRVILATDGDFNVGTTDNGSLTDLVAKEAKSGVFISVLGFGMGNYKDHRLEQIADKGNGNFAYIDSEREAEKVLVREMGGTLFTIAKDVKIQVEFNPTQVSAYRLIGYENRILNKEDFNDDTKDAGEIGAGHTVTALYEVVPFGMVSDLPKVDPLKYQSNGRRAKGSREMLTVKVRYKDPDGEKSRLQEFPVLDNGYGFSSATGDFRFATSVAGFGMVLKKSPHSGSLSFGQVRAMAAGSLGSDPYGDRQEFLTLVEKAQGLSATLTTQNEVPAVTD